MQLETWNEVQSFSFGTNIDTRLTHDRIYGRTESMSPGCRIVPLNTGDNSMGERVL